MLSSWKATMKFEKMNLVTKHGKFKDSDGNLKSGWIKVGETHETRNGGLSLKIDSLPIDFDGWINLAAPTDVDYNF